jgi:hypothetical protein
MNGLGNRTARFALLLQIDELERQKVRTRDAVRPMLKAFKEEYRDGLVDCFTGTDGTMDQEDQACIDNLDRIIAEVEKAIAITPEAPR